MEKENALQPEINQLVAYHEAGHVVACWFLEHCNPLKDVTMIPTEESLGSTKLINERILFTTEELFDSLRFELSGRVSEQIVFGVVRNANDYDFEKALLYAFEQLFDRICSWLGGRKLTEIFFGVFQAANDDFKKVLLQAFAQVTELFIFNHQSSAYSQLEYVDIAQPCSEAIAQIIDSKFKKIVSELCVQGATFKWFLKIVESLNKVETDEKVYKYFHFLLVLVNNMPHAEPILQKILFEVRQMCLREYVRTSKLLQEHRKDIEKVALCLLEKKILTADDVLEILGPRPVKEKSTCKEGAGSSEENITLPTDKKLKDKSGDSPSSNEVPPWLLFYQKIREIHGKIGNKTLCNFFLLFKLRIQLLLWKMRKSF